MFSIKQIHLLRQRRYNTETVSGDVLARMKQQMMDSNSSSSHSFLLDDDSTLPFAAAEVLGAMDDKVCRTEEMGRGLENQHTTIVNLRISQLIFLLHAYDCIAVLVQDLYLGLLVPDALKKGDTSGGFAFLEKELRFSQAAA